PSTRNDWSFMVLTFALLPDRCPGSTCLWVFLKKMIFLLAPKIKPSVMTPLHRLF
ncbi:hypothetical protein M2447_002730, partial [Ereboglobus sp. PH5-10]|nr:hypothetical protein [Ereboglobus sp. PH5-10]